MSGNWPKLGAIAVVIHEGATLLVQRGAPPDAGLWGFPGGHVEPGETALEAARRELLEETSIAADPLGYLTNVDVIARDTDGRLIRHYLLAAVICRYRSGTPKAGDDAADARWVGVGETDKLPLTDRVSKILGLALSHPSAR